MLTVLEYKYNKKHLSSKLTKGGKHANNGIKGIKDKPLWGHKGGGYLFRQGGIQEMRQAFSRREVLELMCEE